MPFLKFQYGNRIKKIQLTNEELSWSSITDILTKSFLFAEKDKLKVTYKVRFIPFETINFHYPGPRKR